MKIRYILVFILVMFITGCNENKEASDKFYLEYSKYNDDANYINVELDNSSIFKYNVENDIDSIIKNNAIIFVGNGKDNKSRNVVNILDKVINNTDVSVIYYYDNIDYIKKYVDDNMDTPLVIFFVDGKVDSYVVNDKDKLDEDSELELYNKYLDGVHKVLGDVCDEEC